MCEERKELDRVIFKEILGITQREINKLSLLYLL